MQYGLMGFINRFWTSWEPMYGRRGWEDRKIVKFDKVHSEDRAKGQESEHGNPSRDAFRAEAARRPIDK